MITRRTDQPNMDARISMNIKPIFEEGKNISWWGSRIDPRWTFTDPDGHFFQIEGFYASVHDTPYYCVDCGYEHGDGVWLCNICNYPIKRKMISGSCIASFRMPDRTSGYEAEICFNKAGNHVIEYKTGDTTIIQRILDSGTIDAETEVLLEPYITRQEWYS